MRSVNKVILVGHLAADPETSTAPNGKSRTVFPMATHRSTTSDGEPKEVTDYHRIIAWGKLGEICSTYLAKGTGIYLEGRILNRAYEKDGERKYITEICADEINLLAFKKKDGINQVSLETAETA